MLNALGGRRAWAALTTLVNDSQQNRVEEPTVVRAVISLDVTQPRFRIETTAPDLHLIRVVDGERNWRLSREGKIEPVPQATLTGDARWYAGHVYRTIHRIAKRDASIRLALAADARLEVYEGPARVAWFKLDARGEPYAFGSHDDDKGSLSGPWNVLQDGIHHPSWTAVADGTWRAQLVSFRANVPLDDALFTQPARIASFAQLSGGWRGAGTFRGAPTDIAPLIASGRIHLVCGSNDALGALPSGFDRVYSVNTLQFVSNRLDLLTTMYALLRPGGRLLILHQARVRGARSADSLAFAERLADEMRQGGLGEPQVVPGPKRTVRWMSVELARPAVH
jgi:hypothetical protein